MWEWHERENVCLLQLLPRVVSLLELMWGSLARKGGKQEPCRRFAFRKSDLHSAVL